MKLLHRYAHVGDECVVFLQEIPELYEYCYGCGHSYDGGHRYDSLGF